MDFLTKIRHRLAETSVGGSALRNQGAARMVVTSRNFLKGIDLYAFKNSLASKQDFEQFLNDRTNELADKFQQLEGFKLNEGEGFGAARKSLNLFFRDIVYNKFLAEQLGLPTDLERYNLAIQFLEIPLDKDAAEGIFNGCSKYRIEVKGLPNLWPRIVHLTHEVSNAFQKAAWEIAIREKTARVHLDLEFWRKTNAKEDLITMETSSNQSD